ncbi:MAG TPA: hypothetical protein VHE30_25725 [Polyangiaceae bacterium]|nr:hypothetical protein [Polyangiaceae bacterium]
MRIVTKAAGTVLLLTGCSLINSLDAVKPQATDEDSGAHGGSGSGGKGGSASGGKGGSLSDAGSGGSSGGNGGTSGSGGGGGTGGGATGGNGPVDSGNPDVFNPNNPAGAIVAYNKPTGTGAPAPSLIVISPTTGEILSSEPMNAVRGIVNDGITDRWYIFEQTTAMPTDPVKLHVRELDTATGRWREIGSATGLPVPAGRLVPLKDRLAYLSTPTPISPNPATHTLTILDVADPANITIFGGAAAANRPVLNGLRKAGMVGRPANNNPGGTLDVMGIAATCDPLEGGVSGCDVTLASFTVNGANQFSAGPTKVVGQVDPKGTAQIDRDPGNADAVVVAFPSIPTVAELKPDCSSPNNPRKGSVEKFGPLDFSNVGQDPVPYTIVSENLTSAAFDTCLNVEFVGTQINDRALWSIPLTPGGTTVHSCRGTGVGTLVFEPYTRTLIVVPTNSGLPEFYAVGGDASKVTLTALSPPKLPSNNFAPFGIVVRQPPGYKPKCN